MGFSSPSDGGLVELPESAFSDILGMVELMPEQMYAAATVPIDEGGDGILETIPSAAMVDLQLLGISGFRYGDMFRVERILPNTYDSGFFFLTGFKHVINNQGWVTNIQGQFLGKRIDG